jgi:hypothetical protein
MNAAIELPDTVLDEIAQRAVAILAAGSQQPTPEPWLNVEQAAAHLAISTSQFYTLCSQRQVGGIPITKEGSRTYAKASELDAWRASR